MTSIKKICLLSSLLFFLGSGCTTSSNNRYNFSPTNPAPIKYYPIDKEQAVTFSNSIRPIQGELKAKYDLARHFQRLQKHRIAIEALREVIQMDPTHAYAHNAMGYSYDCLGDYQTAQQHYRTAIVLNPELDYAYNNLGYSYILDGKYAAAIETLKQAIALNENNPKYHKNLGLAYFNSNNMEMAATKFPRIDDAIRNEKIMARNASPEGEQAATRETIEQERLNTIDVSQRMEQLYIEAVKTEESPTLQTKIEVSNGNGVNGMARSVGNYLKTNGIIHYRLTNADHFNYTKTIIYYRDGFYDQASRIKGLLPGLSNSEHLVAAHLERESIRVLIGRDLVPFNPHTEATVEVDVSNGNGVNGMARRLGKYLNEEGFKVGRLTNADHFDYEKTIVFYSKGQASHAKRLADALPENCSSRLVELNNPNDRVQVLLGSDMVF